MDNFDNNEINKEAPSEMNSEKNEREPLVESNTELTSESEPTAPVKASAANEEKTDEEQKGEQETEQKSAESSASSFPPQQSPGIPGPDWNTSQYYFPQKPPRKKINGFTVFAIVISVFLLIGIGLTVLYSVLREFDFINPGDNSDSIPNSSLSLELGDKPQSEPQELPAGVLTTVEIAKKVNPSVVGIVTYVRGSTTPAGAGSGIIMSADGYIITNAHVVSGADGIEVVLPNGERHEAKIIGSDERTDLAVLKIEKTGLSFAIFGNSDQCEVGEMVVAIGNPSGLTLAGSVTVGYISGKDRAITIDGYTMNYMQTDAAINPGNSGGALVNQFGQVIGINSAKITATEYEGIGFAIPINEAKPIIDSLLQYGYVKDRVRLGIEFRAISAVASKYYGVPQGLQVINIDRGCDAYGKLYKGDIITKIDGKEVTTSETVHKILERYKPGDKITLTIYRTEYSKGKTIEVTVKLSEDTGKTDFSD